MSEKLLVYTNCIGWDYELPPVTPTDDVDYICVTDREISNSTNGWQTMHIEPLLPDDKFRSSREPKTLPHLFFPGYRRSLYLDSTVKLKTNPSQLWQHLIRDKKTIFGGVHHSFRRTVKDEFIAVNSAKYDKTTTLQDQMVAYHLHYPNILTAQPVWGGMLARRHNDPDCITSMNIWFANILRYSRRDQLSLPIALAKLRPEQINVVNFDLHDSIFHTWPFGGTKKPPYQTVN